MELVIYFDQITLVIVLTVKSLHRITFVNRTLMESKISAEMILVLSVTVPRSRVSFPRTISPKRNLLSHSSSIVVPIGGEMENCSERFLFGGAISSNLPVRFEDVSNIRQVPDHQEAFVDLARDESVLFELLDLKNDVADDGSAVWFLRDLATEQDAEENLVIEHSGSTERISLHGGYPPPIVNTAIGQMAVSKEREGNSARNIIRVYVANLRLKDVNTDVLITANEPVDINPLSASAKTVRAGPAVPASLSECMPVAEVFKIAVTSFKVHDWDLFCAGS